MPDKKRYSEMKSKFNAMNDPALKMGQAMKTAKKAASTRSRAAARAVGAEGPKKSTPARTATRRQNKQEGPKKSVKVTAAQKKAAAKKRASKPKMRLS